MMDNRYEEALEKAMELYLKSKDTAARNVLEEVFPELKESSDEEIRKGLIDFFKIGAENGEQTNGIYDKDILAWLEKQGKQKKLVPKFKIGDTMRTLQEAADGYTDGMPVVISVDKEYYHCTNELIAIKDQDDYEFPPMNRTQTHTDKVEPKFKVGDWIVNNDSDRIYQIKSIKNYEYCLWPLDSNIEGFLRIANVDNDFHLWDITKDAKKGDVLATKDAVFIFKYMDKAGLSFCKSYCEVIGNSKLGLGFDFSINGVYPATKEQCNTLKKAMADAGYVFDYDKKELKEDEPENFKQQLISEMADLVKDYIQQKPTAWSEEDEGLLELTVAAIEDFYDDKNPLRYRLIEWLKSLKQGIGK